MFFLIDPSNIHPYILKSGEGSLITLECLLHLRNSVSIPFISYQQMHFCFNSVTMPYNFYHSGFAHRRPLHVFFKRFTFTLPRTKFRNLLLLGEAGGISRQCLARSRERTKEALGVQEYNDLKMGVLDTKFPKLILLWLLIYM